MSKRRFQAGLLFALSFAASVHADETIPSQEDLNFFEQRIRPVLVRHCYQCHAVDSNNIKGGLLLDSKAGMLKGGDSGPSVVPKVLNESLILDALKFETFQMPPKGKLSDEIIADFEKWVVMGAPDPRDGATVIRTEIDFEQGRKHWSYQPIKILKPPSVHDNSWPYNNIDHFILARLESSGLQPGRDASKSVLVRRLYFDLTGLPPTPEEITRFVNNDSPTAYEDLVDRLLTSPRFGERWGRHWLDVSRYGESMSLRGRILKHAWRYRDYVIEAFNNDKPFNQFLTQQLAGDLLVAASVHKQRQNRIATTYLVMGDTLLENQNKSQLDMDVVDEQLDTIGRGLLAQTIACARCHDHKFDPIPTRDYYAIAGILKNAQGLKHSNVSTTIEIPLPYTEEMTRELEIHNASVAKLEDKLASLKAQLPPPSNAPFPRVVTASSLAGIVVDDGDVKRVGKWTHSVYSKHYVGKGYIHDDNKEKGAKTLAYIPELTNGEYEVRFAYSWGGGRASNVPVEIISTTGKELVVVDMRKEPKLNKRFVSLGTYNFVANKQHGVLISNEGTNGIVTADAMQFLPIKKDGGTPRPASQLATKQDIAKQQDIKKEISTLTAELSRINQQKPVPEMVNSVVEKKESTDLRVHIRGSIDNLGEIAPRGVLQVANYGPALEMPASSSGRLELANWVVDPDNPLTSRVMVNRIWHWLIGEGLVRTVDNFGTRGELPSHPKLLDHLAVQFIEEDWSVKKLIRSIVLTRTYRLSSKQEGGQSKDPENRLLAHMNHRRLDAESLRDTMLCLGGTLDLTMGGPTYPANLKTDVGFRFQEPRRSVFVPVFRSSLPEVFEVFDFANPSMVIGRREVSTVAPQALFMMNHGFVRSHARFTAERLLNTAGLTEIHRIERAYLKILGRDPTAKELSLTQQFLESFANTTEEGRIDAWAQVVQSMFLTIDFRYIR